MDVLGRPSALESQAGAGARMRRLLWTLIAIALVARIATLGLYPLMDNTEARYAEVARKMLETGDWVTPQFRYGVPFWSKPPAAVWVTAASMGVFGVNEFAARLPALLCCIGIAALAWQLARRTLGADVAVHAVAVLTTTALFFVAAGAVMTDAQLALGTMLSMTAFYMAVRGDPARRRLWGYAFFVGLAIGLLAKGPVGVVLTAVPTGLWTIWRRAYGDVWRRIPWITGTLLCAALALPWYLLAEQRTPGFIEYFIVGEHWKRYTVAGWDGDMFGTAHAQPRGLIWPLAILSTLPWCAVWVFLAWSRRRAKEPPAPWTDGGDLRAYLVLWMLTPAVFFTFAGNILFTYVLPGLPAFAILVAHCWNGLAESTVWRRAVKYHALIVPLGAAAAILIVVPRLAPTFTQQDLAARYVAARASPAESIVYYREAPHSAEFYLRGKTKTAATREDLARYLAAPGRTFFVVKQNELEELAELRAGTEEVARSGRFRLLVKK